MQCFADMNDVNEVVFRRYIDQKAQKQNLHVMFCKSVFSAVHFVRYYELSIYIYTISTKSKRSVLIALVFMSHVFKIKRTINQSI